MVRRNTRVEKSSNISFRFLNSKYFPLIMCFCFLGIGFVVARMKGIEQDYQFNDHNKKLNTVSLKTKELKAHKAQLLSIKNLREIAKKYDLKEPDHNQIIIIP